MFLIMRRSISIPLLLLTLSFLIDVAFFHRCLFPFVPSGRVGVRIASAVPPSTRFMPPVFIWIRQWTQRIITAIPLLFFLLLSIPFFTTRRISSMSVPASPFWRIIIIPSWRLAVSTFLSPLIFVGLFMWFGTCRSFSFLRLRRIMLTRFLWILFISLVFIKWISIYKKIHSKYMQQFYNRINVQVLYLVLWAPAWGLNITHEWMSIAKSSMASVKRNQHNLLV